MRLHAGTRLGPYEVLDLLGAGGMGEVYRGRDTRLNRTVALKVLAPALATDDDFRTRFTREARAVSALNHPHICGLYDIGRDHDIEYLVLEFLEGETLDARLRRGALPMAEVLRFGAEIADALAAAHRQGIIHRDLKPGNVLITKGGAKLLDFGLAKTIALAGLPAAESVTAPGDTATAAGAIVGTLQYMAPEQVTGRPADARTDIFATGTILHEMSTGQRAFQADSPAGLIAKILTGAVPAASTFTSGVPSAFDHVVHACLAKDPEDRWATAHDLKLQLQWIQTEGSRPTAGEIAPSVQTHRTWLPWTLAALGLGLVALTTFLRPSPPTPLQLVPARLELTLPPDMRLDSFDRAAISPDGGRIVVSGSVQGRQQLFMRELASMRMNALDDSEGAQNPFWSPDSQSIGFFAGDKLKRLGVGGGPATVLADAKLWSRARGGATWGRGTILFPASDGSIMQVADTGGIATVVATVPWVPGQRTFFAPRFLPDGRRFFISADGDSAPFVASLDTPALQKLPQDGSRASYAAGQLLYHRGGSAFARAFDVSRTTFTGPERLVADGVTFVSASDTGTVLHRTTRTASSRLSWFDRRGQLLGTIGDPGEYRHLTLSPRGTRATVVRSDGQGEWSSADLWDLDLTSGILTRLTSNDTMDADPSWSPDERRLAFTSSRSGRNGVYLRDVVTGIEAPLVLIEESVNLDEWTPDGRFVIFRNRARAVWSVEVDGDRTPRMLVDTSYSEDEVHVSTDGRWVAYNADESGRWEVYVASFPEFVPKRQVSSGGGVQPQWSRDGRELFYLAPDGSLMSVRVNTSQGLEVSPPVTLFATSFDSNPHGAQYAVSANGSRFFGLARIPGERTTLTVLLNGVATDTGGSAR